MQDEENMKLNSAAVAFMVGVLSVFGAGISYAGEHEKHVAEAVAAEHARQALSHLDMAYKGTEETQ